MAKSATRAQTLKGNKNAIKLKTPELKKEAYRQYLAHIAGGYPKESFSFDHPDIDITWETLDKYIEEDPTEFSPILMKKARAERYKTLFDEGITLMKGGYPGGSPVVWQTIMRNIFKAEKWDQKEPEENMGASDSAKFQLAQAKALPTGDQNA